MLWKDLQEIPIPWVSKFRKKQATEIANRESIDDRTGALASTSCKSTTKKKCYVYSCIRPLMHMCNWTMALSAILSGLLLQSRRQYCDNGSLGDELVSEVLILLDLCDSSNPTVWHSFQPSFSCLKCACLHFTRCADIPLSQLLSDICFYSSPSPDIAQASKPVLPHEGPSCTPPVGFYVHV